MIAWVVVALLAGGVRADPAPAPSLPESATRPTPVVVFDPGKPRRQTAQWLGAGALALGLASFTVSLYAKARWDDAVARMNTNDPTVRYDAITDANRAHDIARWYGTGLLAGSAITLGVAGYLYFTAPAREVRRTVIVPTAGPDQLGVSIGGAF